MRITTLLLDRFRSHRLLELAFGEAGIEAFVGENGTGKTNLAEAISFLSLGRSALGGETEDVARWGETFFKVRAATVSDAGEERTLEVVCQLSPRKQKAFFMNDVRVPFAEFVGALPSVVFLPQDLGLFSGGPDRRRGLMDGLLSQLDPKFLPLRMEFERLLKQRNALLKRIGEGEAKEGDLDPWDADLARSGAALQCKRLTIVSGWNEGFPGHVRSLGETWEDIRIEYVRKTTAMKEEALAEELAAQLLHYRSRDCIVGSTTTGPHRDDWRILADGRDISGFASRGQQRASLLALLFTCMDQFRSIKKEQPVIILDDVFSELDDRHQHALLTSLAGCQVFLTATHLPGDIGAPVHRWQVSAEGVVAGE
ncbi:MAG TPA: DNA replication and repair protein RecF [Candidatus Peribacteria bacterium]|nr:DNA replication and repair protein RecF [Candidatus Peribacteria bacterium]